MKKWVLILSLLFVIGFAIINIKPLIKSEIEINEHGITFNETEFKQMESVKILVEQIYQGNLLLVNNEHPVREEYLTTDVINLFSHDELIEGYSLLDSEIYLSENIAYKFSEMVTAAKKDGVLNFSVNSGYRSLAAQDTLYQAMGSEFALPAGYSEHNLGLALDVGSTETLMAESIEGKWIEKNAWKYGFILRYPLHKTEITGIQYEPWHIRYVDLPHSAIMQERDFVLEEYLDYLKEVKVISVNLNDQKYKVTYYPITQNKFIEHPKDRDYQISGNNIDGVIVTSYE